MAIEVPRHIGNAGVKALSRRSIFNSPPVGNSFTFQVIHLNKTLRKQVLEIFEVLTSHM